MLGMRKTTEKLVGQLRGFSGTARLLFGALMVILVMGLVLVMTFAGRSELTALGIGANVKPEIRTAAVQYLDSRGIKWAETGTGDLLVPAEQKYQVLAQLTENKLITTEQIDFGSILQDDSPFTDRATRQKRFLIVKMSEVSRMISELSGIEHAKVVIDEPDRSGGLGAARIASTASVTVLPTGDQLLQTKADAIARLVAGAHADLKVENVTVVDARTGRAMIARNDDDLPATRYLEMKRAHEKLAKQTIERALSVYPGVVVAVNAHVNATEEVLESTTYNDPKSGLAAESNREQTSTTETGSREPGVRPNTGQDLAGRNRSTVMSDIRGDSKLVNAFGNTESHRRDPKGYAVQINATVLVPRSYVMRLLQGAPGPEEAEPPAPDPQAVEAKSVEVRDEIKRLVEPLIDTGPLSGAVPGTVVVSTFADAIGTSLGVPGGGSASAGGSGFAGGMVSEGIIKTGGLGALALVSLTLMFMMVRRASREEELPSAEELVGIPPALTGPDSDLVGEADETVAAMEGLEIGEDAVRRQQMIEQINDLAANAPDEAAALLRKWIKIDE